MRPFVLAALVVALGCNSARSSPDAGGAVTAPAPVPAPASAAVAPPVPAPVLAARPTSFAAADGMPLSGELVLAEDRTAPAVVLVHRFRGDRSEWAPLLRRMARSTKPFSVLSFDLRGHGASRSSDPKKSVDWTTMKPKDMAAFDGDVSAATAELLKATDGQARGVILVGSSLGAALVARVAWSEPKVIALAMVSPGAGIQGVDVYQPFAEVRNLPLFVAGADDDTISREPRDALVRMAASATPKRYSGELHSAGFLATVHPELWDDLVAWLETVRDAPVVERRSLYYAPGKEPKAKGARPAQASGR